ncbi:hypothetical protein FACS1894155_11630 [Bacteroidia bacterium]|nr:hypothetical protein FACS1894155_11630 [Bacteroidia bacterium]
MKPEFVIGQLLLEKKLTLSTAESCTGGKIAGLITSVPGSSAYFKGGIVAYSNEVKQNILNVSGADLEKYGAVSEPVVLQMVTGVRQVLKTDCAISISGIAGPDGGSPEKPVGTVWIAALYKEKLVARKFHFSGCREENMLLAANTGINMLIELLNG